MSNVKIEQIIAEVAFKNRWPSSFVYQILAEIGFQKFMQVFVHQITVEVGYFARTYNIYVRGCRYRSDTEGFSEAIKIGDNRWMSETVTGNILTEGVDYE